MFLLDNSRSKLRMTLASINFISAQARLRQVLASVSLSTYNSTHGFPIQLRGPTRKGAKASFLS